MQELKSDLSRAFRKPFLFAMLGVFLLVIFGAFREVLTVFQMSKPSAMLYAHRSITLRALSSDAMLFAAPLFAPIPFAGAFVDDVKSGYLKAYLPRTSVSRYILGKELACALSGGLALGGGILLAHILITLLLVPVETFSGMPVDSQLDLLSGRIGLYVLFGAVFAITGLLLSTMTMNGYMAYAAPFILYYVLIIIQERYARDAFMLNPKNYLTLTGAWPFGGWSAALMVLFVGMMLLFFLIAQGHLRDDNARKSIRTLLPSRPIRIKENAKVRRKKESFRTLRQIFSVTQYNFRMWRGNARVMLTFALAFVLCFLLSDKAAAFAYDMGTTMQAFEPFVWTFGDANSVLLVSLLLILLFVDMPFLGAGVPYYLIRMKRRTWLIGQAVYEILATIVYILFIFLATTVICMGNSFIGNMWSETAAILGYSGVGKAVALPALVKVLELSRPYQCAGTILLLMLLYTLLLVFFMFFVNIRRGRAAGIVAAFSLSLFGFLLNPELFKQLFDLPNELMYKANVAVGWLSPLNHATYHMHNFGYDLLPRLWQTELIFTATILLLFLITIRSLKTYNFHFTGIDE